MHRPISLDLVHAHQQQLRDEARRQRIVERVARETRVVTPARTFGFRLGLAR
jgi:hypothetical protein